MKYYDKIRVLLPAGEVTTVSFHGRMPNYFRVANGGNVAIYCGLQNTPTPTNYEFKVEAKNTRMYCEDFGYRQIYIFNPSTEDIYILLYSYNAEFDPVVQAMTDFVFAVNETQAVEIQGFTNPLPTGNNVIGKVGLDAESKTLLESLVKVQNAELKTASGNVSQVITENMIREIAFFSNDGETDMTLAIGDYSVVVKAGEVINHVKCAVDTVSITASENWRIAYNIY